MLDDDAASFPLMAALLLLSKSRPSGVSYGSAIRVPESERAFRAVFGVASTSVSFLCARLEIPRFQLLCGLAYFGSRDSYSAIADNRGIPTMTLHHAVRLLTDRCIAIRDEVIRFPDSVALRRAERVTACAIPGVVGFTDGSLFPFRGAVHDKSLFSRQRKPNLLAIVTCGPDKDIWHIDASFLGAQHDSMAFQMTTLYQHLHELLPGNYRLLGDCGFALHEKMLTPFRAPRRRRGAPVVRMPAYRVIFNRALRKKRVRVEHLFGVAKGRFRRLYALSAADVGYAQRQVLAIFVLYQLTHRDAYAPEVEERVRRRLARGRPAHVGNIGVAPLRRGHAAAVRERLARALYASYRRNRGL